MYRKEYPRPQFKRKDWMSLNGKWEFFMREKSMGKIEVPFVFQSRLSGINTNEPCDFVTYERTFKIPKEWEKEKIRIYFGAVDYQCSIYINEQYVGEHVGGNTSFSLDITKYLKEENSIRVEVFDPCKDETIPRGKQYWKEKPESIWYTRSTGIWQSVFIEPVSEKHFSYIHFTPDIDKGFVEIDMELEGWYTKDNEDLEAEIEISFEGNHIFKGNIEVYEKHTSFSVDLFNRMIMRTMNHDGGWCWSPENPKLFQVKARLLQKKKELDCVETYFGMRKIEIQNGMVYLNNRPYYQKLVLDQGYWKDSLMTAKSEEDYKKDISMAKEMGFNGCRKHQKAEDPVFLYYADKMGFLVWAEIGACASYSIEASQRTMQEWSEIVQRDYNHPCIVTWVVLNESWGVPNIRFDRKQQAHSLALYYNVKSMDTTRLVISNDGWEMTKTDICAIHNYEHGGKAEPIKQENFKKALSNKEEILNAVPTGRMIYAQGYQHEGEPILLTEFGGLSYSKDSEKGWGYTTIDSDEEFVETYKRLIEAIQDSEILFGYCYTQLTDVEQEVNGLLTAERQYKIQPEKIKEINDRIYKIYINR